MWVLDLRFLAGRYHATPWDRHVNEGAVEWPPAPWRICRALYATFYGRAPELSEDVVRSLLHKLSSQLPVFRLPRASVAHTRHYMPIGLDKKSYQDKTTKVFDTFVALEIGETLTVGWPSVEFEDTELDALRTLASRLTYFGRAESWVEAQVRAYDPGQDIWNAQPAELSATSTVRVLSPMPAEQYAVWRTGALASLETRLLSARVEAAAAKGKPAPKSKLSSKDVASLEEQIPKTLFDAFSATTTDLRNAGWSQPPGTVWAEYERPADIFAATRVSRVRQHSGSAPTVMRFAISSTVRPSIDDAMSVCDRLRQSLIKHSDGASVFTGRDASGDVASNDHRHAHFFAESETEDGRISHLSVFAPSGFDARAREAASRLRRVWGREGYDIDLFLVSVSDTDSLRNAAQRSGLNGIYANSMVWESLTPFVATRHAKYTKSGVPKLDEYGDVIGSPEHDLRRLLRARGLPEILKIERVDALHFSKRRIPWLSFGMKRSGGGTRAANARPVGLRVHFAEPVQGPLCAGFGAHFGLGLMRPG